jgi:UDP-glucose 4-epimerase
LVSDAYQQVFNVGADQPETVLTLAQATAQALGVEPQIQHLPARHEVVHAFASHDKARRVFQPDRPVPLSEGLQRMAQWAQQRGPMTPTEFGAIEVPINLPPSWRKA